MLGTRNTRNPIGTTLVLDAGLTLARLLGTTDLWLCQAHHVFDVAQWKNSFVPLVTNSKTFRGLGYEEQAIASYHSKIQHNPPLLIHLFFSWHQNTRIVEYKHIRTTITHDGTCNGCWFLVIFPSYKTQSTTTTDELFKVQELIQGYISPMSSVRYPPQVGFLIAPEHSASEGKNRRYSDWEAGGLDCWSCLLGSAWWALWGMEPLCLARTPENTWFLPCTCRREPPQHF